MVAALKISSTDIPETSTPLSAVITSALEYPIAISASVASERFPPFAADVETSDIAAALPLVSNAESLSLSSRMILAAVFAPTPFAFESAFESSDDTTRVNF